MLFKMKTESEIAAKDRLYESVEDLVSSEWNRYIRFNEALDEGKSSSVAWTRMLEERTPGLVLSN